MSLSNPGGLANSGTLRNLISPNYTTGTSFMSSNNTPGDYSSLLGKTIQGYLASANGTGGVNYSANGKPITNTIYGQNTGFDTGAIERAAANSATTSPAVATPTTPAEDPRITAAKIEADVQAARDAAAVAAQPKLLYRDTNAAWQTAQNSAAFSVNPVYTDYLNNFITGQKNKLLQNTAEIGAQKGALDTSLTQTNQDIATGKARSTQDTATTIAQNKLNEGNWQTTEGAQAYLQEEQARTAMGDQGTAGRGAGQLGEAKITRNQASKVNTQAFTQERDTANLLKTRTFADLTTKGTRAKKYTETEKANLDRQLGDFILNQGSDLTEFKSTNEQARLDRLRGTTQSEYNTGLGAWLAEQAKGGARAQDLAASRQYYA